VLFRSLRHKPVVWNVDHTYGRVAHIVWRGMLSLGPASISGLSTYHVTTAKWNRDTRTSRARTGSVVGVGAEDATIAQLRAQHRFASVALS